MRDFLEEARSLSLPSVTSRVDYQGENREVGWSGEMRPTGQPLRSAERRERDFSELLEAVLTHHSLIAIPALFAALTMWGAGAVALDNALGSRGLLLVF